jgi:hypothetical protein
LQKKPTSVRVSNALKDECTNLNLIVFQCDFISVSVEELRIVIIAPRNQILADHSNLLEVATELVAALIEDDVDSFVVLQASSTMSCGN